MDTPSIGERLGWRGNRYRMRNEGLGPSMRIWDRSWNRGFSRSLRILKDYLSWSAASVKARGSSLWPKRWSMPEIQILCQSGLLA